MGVKLTGTLQFCDGCSRSKEKSRSVRKKTYTRASNQGESVFVNTTGLFPESLIGGRYWIGVIDDYSRCYWSLFMNAKLEVPNKMEYIFEKMCHAVHQLSAYVVKMRETTNKNCRRCAKKGYD